MSVNTNFPSYLPIQTTMVEKTGDFRFDRLYMIEVDGDLLKVKPGFVTDFSSYPWLTRNVVRFNRVAVAGAVHDELYGSGRFTRAKADRIWREIAIYGPVSANLLQGWVSWLGPVGSVG